jgi:hypothetical protein
MRMGAEKPVTRLAAMPFGPRIILAVAAAGALALGAWGCGSSDDKSIPSSSSDQLLAQLDDVQGQVESGDCEVAKSGAIQFKNSVAGLPSDVDSETKKDLNQLADNLIELTNDPSQCAQEGASGEGGVEPTDTSETEPTTEPTTSTTTTEEETTKPEEAQPAEPEQTESGSQGNQGGDVSGNLGGNGGTSGSTGGVKPGGG